jgi:hypothetical protein
MPDITVRVGQQNAVKVTSTSTGGSSGTLAALSDTDVSAVANGSVLVYDANTSQWVATNTLTPGNTRNLDVNGGTF